MKKEVLVKALPEKERECRYPVGRKYVVVWHYVRGKFTGMYQVCCRIYPELGGMFFEREKAIKRAERIVSYHLRQLELQFDAACVEFNEGKKV